MDFPVRLSERLKKSLPPGVSLFPRPERKRWILSSPGPDGRWKQSTLPACVVSCDDAVAWVRAHVATLPQSPGDALRSHREKGPTLAERSKQWLAILEKDERVAPASLKQHRGMMENWIKPKWGALPLADLDVSQVPALRAWLRELRAAKPDGARTIHNMISSFTRLVDYALAEGWMRSPAGAAADDWLRQAVNVMRHPGVRDELPEVEGEAPIRFPLPVVQGLIDSPNVDLEDRARYALAACEGMRDGEIAGVRLRLLERDKPPTVKIFEAVALVGRKGRGGHAKPKAPKTKGSRRTLPLHLCALEAVNEWIEVGLPRLLGRHPRPDDWLFPRADGGPSRPKSAARLREDLRAAGQPDVVDGRPAEFKTFRSSCFTWLDELGVDERVRKKIAGHRAMDVTEAHYTVRELEQLAAALQKIPLRWTRGIGAAGAGGCTVQSTVQSCTVTDPGSAGSSGKTAEEKGFEPLDDLRRRRFSKRPAAAVPKGQEAGSDGIWPFGTLRGSGQDPASGPASTAAAVQEPEQLELDFDRPASPSAPAVEGPGLARARPRGEQLRRAGGGRTK
jgi:integrase